MSMIQRPAGMSSPSMQSQYGQAGPTMANGSFMQQGPNGFTPSGPMAMGIGGGQYREVGAPRQNPVQQQAGVAGFGANTSGYQQQPSQPMGMSQGAYNNRNAGYGALGANAQGGQSLIQKQAVGLQGPGAPPGQPQTQQGGGANVPGQTSGNVMQRPQQPMGVPGMSSYGALGANTQQSPGGGMGQSPAGSSSGIGSWGGPNPQQQPQQQSALGANTQPQGGGQSGGFQYQDVNGGAWKPPANTSPFSPTASSPYSGTIYGGGDNGMNSNTSMVSNQQGQQVPMQQAMQQGFNPGNYFNQGPMSDGGAQANAQSFMQNRQQLPRY